MGARVWDADRYVGSWVVFDCVVQKVSKLPHALRWSRTAILASETAQSEPCCARVLVAAPSFTAITTSDYVTARSLTQVPQCPSALSTRLAHLPHLWRRISASAASPIGWRLLLPKLRGASAATMPRKVHTIRTPTPAPSRASPLSSQSRPSCHTSHMAPPKYPPTAPYCGCT